MKKFALQRIDSDATSCITVNGAQLKRIRTAMGLTQVQFAECIRMARNSLVRMENGGMLITPSMELLIQFVAKEACVESAAHRGAGRNPAPGPAPRRAGSWYSAGKDRKRKGTDSLPTRGRRRLHQSQD
jgi:DNA-binding XRE family transcriptional regulator